MLETTPGSALEADDALTSPIPESPESPAPAAEPAADAQPRDEQGRFTSPATPAEPAAEPSAPEPAAPPSGEPAEVPPEPPPGEPEVVEPDVPASYRADGQEQEIPGSAVGDDGVFIPTEQWQREVVPLLAAGRQAQGSFRQRLSEASQREQSAVKRAEAAESQMQHILGQFETMVEKGTIGPWLEQVAQNWPILKAEAKARGLELQQQAERQELEQFREQQRMAQLRPVMDQTLEQNVLRYGLQAGLDEAGMTEVYSILHSPRMESVVFVKAPYDDPAAGIRQGELVIDYGVIENAVRLAASGRKQQQVITKAVQANQAQEKRSAPPPTVGGKGSKVPRPGPAIPKFATAKEADAWLERGGYNELELPEE